MTLRSNNFPPQMEKARSDVVKDFYEPCFAAADRYDRLTGYFSSGAMLLYWPSLRQFVSRGGTIRLVCSPALSESDAASIREGYDALEEEELGRALIAELKTMLDDEHLQHAARALAGMIVAGHLELRIAQCLSEPSASAKRMFHDKVGLFVEDGNAVCFRGSMNETFMGLSTMGHTESIDVNLSWEGGRDAERVLAAQRRFEDIWSDREPGLQTRPLPQATFDELRKASEASALELLLEKAAREEGQPLEMVGPAAIPTIAGLPLREHQVRAWRAWEENDRMGIFRHATGAGKTLAALWALGQLLADGFTPLVLVPSQLLFEQWGGDIKRAFPDVKLVKCGAGHTRWRDGGLRSVLISRDANKRVIVATLQTASSQEFLDLVKGGKKVAVIADEVHRVGSAKNRSVTDIPSTARLGLSATPKRYGDPDGTAAIFRYFGNVVDVFTLEDAIDGGVLAPYRYYPHLVSLSDKEQEQWDDLTTMIQRRAARLLGQTTDMPKDATLDRLRIQRARIVKKAQAKSDKAVVILDSAFEEGQRWLVYCEDQTQLTAVRDLLRERGLPAFEYHTGMNGDPEAVLHHFDLDGGIVVSIRCLDEGVDIPAASHALILASSKNPREFIQRRGRILRRSPGKREAVLHDTVAVPGTSHDDELANRLVLAELARAREFSQWSRNPIEAARPLERYCLDRGLDVASLWEEGEEEDEE